MNCTTESIVGKTVEVRDYSYSVELLSGSIKNAYGCLGRVDIGKVVAEDCSLPSSLGLPFKYRNDTIVYMDNGRTIFIEESQLRILSPICGCCGQEVKV